MSRLKITDLGKCVAKSGLLPETASYFINYLQSNKEVLLSYLPTSIPAEKWAENLERMPDEYATKMDLAFIISHLCFSSPEYEETQTPKQRFLPYMLSYNEHESDRVKRLEGILVIRPWDENISSVNAADIATDFAMGVPLSILENRYENLSGGMIHNMLRDHAAHLSGLADILDGLTPPLKEKNRVALAISSPDEQQRRLLRRLSRLIRQFIRQVKSGVPEDVLWMRELKTNTGKPVLSRNAILNLKDQSITTLEDLLDEGKKDGFHQAMNAAKITNLERDRIVLAAHNLRSKKTQFAKERLVRQLGGCGNIIGVYFDSLKTEFEDAIEQCFECLGISVIERDGNGKNRFPDFVIDLNAGVNVVLECKSKENGNAVTLREATDVGGKAVTHGLNRNHMVTVCQPYASTDVPRKIDTAGDLSVVNAKDFALAMGALKQERISMEQFYNWLTTPGQPRIEDLFH